MPLDYAESFLDYIFRLRAQEALEADVVVFGTYALIPRSK